MTKSLVHICIVAPNAYPAVNPQAGQSIGGIETRAWKLATGLAELPDLQVSMIVRHNRPIRLTSVQGVTLAPIVDRFRDVRKVVSQDVSVTSHFPWLRMRRWRWRLLWELPLLAVTRPCRDRQELREQVAAKIQSLRPDVCVTLGNGAVSAAVVRTAANIGRPSILLLASNTDLDPQIFQDDHYVTAYGESALDCRYAVQNASVILCQTEWQRERLQERTGRTGVILRTPIPLAPWACAVERQVAREYVLWIGRFDTAHKRPQLCLEVAKRCPNMSFLLVINRGDRDVEAEIRRQSPPNVRLVDYVPAHEMPDLFRGSRVFLSTGSAEVEGFPNVLLEAAASGTPIVTFNDFGEFVASSGSGKCAHDDIEAAANDLRTLWSDENAWRQCSEAGRTWVAKHHSQERVANAFRAIVHDLLLNEPSTST